MAIIHVRDAQHDNDAVEVPVCVTVKHTFIDVEQTYQSCLRRSASLPPSLRLAGGNAVEYVAGTPRADPLRPLALHPEEETYATPTMQEGPHECRSPWNSVCGDWGYQDALEPAFALTSNVVLVKPIVCKSTPEHGCSSQTQSASTKRGKIFRLRLSRKQAGAVLGPRGSHIQMVTRDSGARLAVSAKDKNSSSDGGRWLTVSGSVPQQRAALLQLAALFKRLLRPAAKAELALPPWSLLPMSDGGLGLGLELGLAIGNACGDGHCHAGSHRGNEEGKGGSGRAATPVSAHDTFAKGAECIMCTNCLTDDVSTEASDDDGSASPSSTATPPNELIDAPPQVLSQTRTPLQSKAKAWTPTDAFSCDFRAIAMVVWTALSQSGYLMDVKVAQMSTGFGVTAVMNQSAFSKWDATLSMAKQALLDAASQSAKLCVLGYKARPFIQTPTGFQAVLAEMPNDDSVCWTAFEEGHCVRGCACRWQHPQRKAEFSMSIRLV